MFHKKRERKKKRFGKGAKHHAKVKTYNWQGVILHQVARWLRGKREGGRFKFSSLAPFHLSPYCSRAAWPTLASHHLLKKGHKAADHFISILCAMLPTCCLTQFSPPSLVQKPDLKANISFHFHIVGGIAYTCPVPTFWMPVLFLSVIVTQYLEVGVHSGWLASTQ